ncbi:MAG TPA: flagellar protein FliT, partial [Casimicrobiaceae bacterium]|nr:flagellar protein FliT [Casimicrobiaceae bacterium]
GGGMSAWNHVLSLTEDMLTAAHAGDFDRVSALDVERRESINRPIVTDAESVSVLEKIVECDRAVVALVESARRFAGEQLRQARAVQSGAGAYIGIAFAR